MACPPLQHLQDRGCEAQLGPLHRTGARNEAVVSRGRRWNSSAGRPLNTKTRKKEVTGINTKWRFPEIGVSPNHPF